MSDSDSARAARLLIRRSRTASLGTLMAAGGAPYVSLVNVASDPLGLPLLLISRLAWHTQNLIADGRGSLLFADAPPAAGDALTERRITVLGRFRQVDAGEVSARFLARHPAAELYAGFADFAFWRLEPEAIHQVAGFGRIETLTPEEVFLAQDRLADTVPSALAHMAEDHADAVRLYATRLLGAPDGDWQMTALDADGADLRLGESVIRLAFPEPVESPGALRAMLARLAAQARA